MHREMTMLVVDKVTGKKKRIKYRIPEEPRDPHQVCQHHPQSFRNTPLNPFAIQATHLIKILSQFSLQPTLQHPTTHLLNACNLNIPFNPTSGMSMYIQEPR